MPPRSDGPAPAQRPPAAGPAARGAAAGRAAARAGPLLPTAGLLLLLGWVFRSQIASGLSVTFGDRFDGFIAIQEHWFAVLSGAAPAATVPWFAGTPGSLGFNDIYLLHGLGYAVARALGADPFLAAEAVNAVLLASFYAALVAAARPGLGLPWLWATAAGLIGAGGSALVQDMHQAQFFALGPMAWALLLGGAALRRLAAGQRAAGLACRGEVPIQPRTRHPVVPGSLAGAWLARGFAESEPWGTWTEGEVADLLIPLPEGWRGGVIRLELRAFAPWRHERSVLLRTAEDAFPADIPTGSIATLFLPVRQSRLFALRIEVSDPASPRELGLGADPRRLGVALIAITLLPDGE